MIKQGTFHLLLLRKSRYCVFVFLTTIKEDTERRKEEVCLKKF